MSKTKKLIKYGNILFLVGILIALIGGLLNLATQNSRIVIATLFIIGIGVGILNITTKESVPFILSGIAIVMLSQPMLVGISQSFGIGDIAFKILGGIYTYLVALIVPAVLVVAFRTCFQTAKD